MLGPLETPAADPPTGERARGRRGAAVLLAFGLANAGAVIGYLPLLSLLLPLKVAAVAGDARLGVLTACAMLGAVAASLANILFGWLSDASVARGGGRRGWIAMGAVATIASFAGVAAARTPTAIVLAVIVFQLAVNAIIAPLLAMMAEEIPDAQKGVAGGLLAFGAPLASGLSALAVVVAAGESARFALISAALALCLSPLLLGAPMRPLAPEPRRASVAAALRRDLAIAWGARLLVQIATVVLGLYLLYILESIAARPVAEIVPLAAQVQAAATVIAAPLAILLGRLSDRVGRRKPFLLAAALLAAAGLVAMAETASWPVAAVGYGAYAIGSAIFLALHIAFSMQLLPDPTHRGRDLGFYNLTNTLPSLLGPVLTWSLATPNDFRAVLLALAVLTLTGGLAMLATRARA